MLIRGSTVTPTVKSIDQVGAYGCFAVAIIAAPNQAIIGAPNLT